MSITFEPLWVAMAIITMSYTFIACYVIAAYNRS